MRALIPARVLLGRAGRGVGSEVIDRRQVWGNVLYRDCRDHVRVAEGVRSYQLINMADLTGGS